MAGSLLFTVFMDHQVLNNIHIIDVATIGSSRTMKAIEVILADNVELKHIKSCKNVVADYLSIR